MGQVNSLSIFSSLTAGICVSGVNGVSGYGPSIMGTIQYNRHVFDIGITGKPS